jgi:hypothetical protein
VGARHAAGNRRALIYRPGAMKHMQTPADHELQAYGLRGQHRPAGRWPHISGIAALDDGITYYDLSGYGLGSGPPVPDDWFTGALDRRFGFDADGIVFGRSTSPQ